MAEFYDDFELGNFDKWTADPMGYGFDIITNPVRGVYAAQSKSPENGALWHTLTGVPTTKCIIDFYLYLKGDSIPVGVGGDVLLRVYNASELLDIQVYIVTGQVAGKYSLRLYDNSVGGNNDFGTTGLELNTWYHLRLEVEVLNVSATHELYLNDALECSIADNTATYNVTRFSFDPVVNGVPYNLRGIIDDVYCYYDLVEGSGIIIGNSGGNLQTERPIGYSERQACGVAIRGVPLRTTGSFVDTGTWTLRNRRLYMTIRLTGAEKTTLQAIFDATAIVTIVMKTTSADYPRWTYTAWFEKKPLIYEYSKNGNGSAREWLAELEFVCSAFSYAESA